LNACAANFHRSCCNLAVLAIATAVALLADSRVEATAAATAASTMCSSGLWRRRRMNAMQNSGRPQHIIAASPPAVADSITTFSSSHVGPGSVQLRPTCGITSVRVLLVRK
jgi:hypothetical protein